MLKRYSGFLASGQRIFAQKGFLCHQKPPAASPRIFTRYGVEDHRYRARQTGTILKNPSFDDNEENFTGIRTPVQMAENFLIDLTTSDRLATDRPLVKALSWVPCIFFNKIIADGNTKFLTEFISNGGWSNWLTSIDNLFQSKKMNAYYLLVAVKWIVKLHKILIDKKLDDQLDDIINLTDGTRLISWLTFIFGDSESLNIAHITSLLSTTCYIVENLDKKTSNGGENPYRLLIDHKLKVEIRKNLIRIYNAFKMDRQCRQRATDEIQTFASTFYRLLCKLQVFDQRFYDPTISTEKIDNRFLQENNLADIYELESYLATIDTIKAKLTDDFVYVSAYMSKLRDQNTQFSELVYSMQFAELVNLFNLVDDKWTDADRKFSELLLFRLKVFASSYLKKTNLTSASILRLFLLISLKNERLNVFNQFKKDYFEEKFRENLPFLNDEQLAEMKALVGDKLSVNLDSLYK